MRVAVTGATGFIGRYILEELTSQGHLCRCWYRDRSDRPVPASTDKVTWLPGQLNDETATRSLVTGCDAVIHGALDRPGVGFRGAEGDVVSFVETNVLGTLRLIEAARAAGVPRFVFISTCAVHEKILDDRPLDETHPAWPMTHYGAHKAALERFVHSYGYGQGYEICALRPSGVYGVARPVTDSKWYDLIRRVVDGDEVECNRGGKEVHAMDVARAASLLLTAPGIAGEAYNCCDRYVSEYEVAQIAKQVSGSSAKILGRITAPKHQIETSKLQRLGMQFGGEAQLRTTIQQMVEEIRAR